MVLMFWLMPLLGSGEKLACHFHANYYAYESVCGLYIKWSRQHNNEKLMEQILGHATCRLL